MTTVTATAARRRSIALPGHPRLIRASIVVAALLVSVAVVRSGLANALGDADPIAAAAVDSSDATAAGAAARTRVERGESPSSPAVRALVRRALLRNATLTTAIELRALDLQSSGKARGAARLFQLSRQISRRSLATHLWLIQRAVDRGNAAQALGEFDVALRTSSAAPQLLFPVLTRASADPTLAGRIAHLLDRPSDWREMFLDYALHKPGSAPSLLPLLLRMRDRAFIKDRQLDRLLISQLVKVNAFPEARLAEQAFGPPAAPSALVRDADFSQPQFRYPFGWGLIEAAGTWAERDGRNPRPVLAYRSAPGGTGQVATQLLTLKPGRYRMRARNAVAPADRSALPYWTVTCAGRQPVQIALIDQPATSDGGGDFDVPPGCGGQWLALNLRASDLRDGQSGAIRSVTLAAY